MNRLIEILRNKIQRRPEEQFQDSDWALMEKKLDSTAAKPKSRIVPLLLWIAIPILGLWTILNTINSVENANSKTVNKKQQFNTITEINCDYFHTDTIYLKSIVYQPTIIYRDKPIYQDALLANLETSVHQDKGDKTDNTVAAISTVSKNSLPPNLPSDAIISSNSSKTDIPTHVIEKNPENFAQEPFMPTIDESSAKQKRIQVFNKPEEFKAGISVGYPFILHSNITNKFGVEIGAHVQAAWNNNFGIGIQLNYKQLYFETTRFDNSLGLPIINPPSSDLFLSKIEVKKPVYQADVSLLYKYMLKKQLHATAGIGLAASFSNIQYLTYEFDHQSQAVQWLFEQEPTPASKFSTSLICSNTFEYEINSIYNIYFGLQYQLGLHKNINVIPQHIDTKIGILRSF